MELGPQQRKATNKQKDRALRRSEEQFRLLVDSLKDCAIFMLDLEGHVASWNPGAERIKGYRAEEILGRHVSIFYPPEDVDCGIPDAQLRQVLLGSRVTDEGWRIRKDGSRFWANGSLAAVRNGGGNVIGFAKITRDLTERRRHEEALRESQAHTRRIIDTALDAVMTIDEDGIIREWNLQAERIFGWRYDEAVGRRMSELSIPPRYRTAHEKGLRHFLATGTGQLLNRRVEITAIRRDGSEFPVELSVVPYRAGEAWFFSGFVRDITKRTRAEAEARESERRYQEVQEDLAHANRIATVGQLTASIAHEINQPIAAVITNAQAALRWLGHRPPDLQETRLALDRIVQNGSRAGDVIDRIRALVRKAPPRKGRLEINGTIGEVVELIRREAVQNAVSVQVELAERLPLIEGDRVQLQQVILNLIINAIEAISGDSDSSRELLISTRKAEPGTVLVAVRDSGPGLVPATLENLFDAFYTTKPGGLGLGLSICRSIIEAHGGRLWAEANMPRGAIFQFTVPSDPGSTS